MNAFANSLFSLLFGWLRTLVQGIWNAVTSGSLSGFFTWLGDHWLWVMLVLGLGATVLDMIIWLFRWRPYLVWKTKLRRLIRFFRYGKQEPPRQFDQGYEDAVPLGYYPDEEAAPWPQEAEYAPAFQQEYAPPSPAQPQEEYTPHPSYYEIDAPDLTPPPAAPEADAPAAPRRRRSARYEQPRPSWHDRLITTGDEDEMLDGLPPLMNKEDAFHQPVYPQHSQQGYAAWQRPPAQNQGLDHQA